jgi:hypothetical protein
VAIDHRSNPCASCDSNLQVGHIQYLSSYTDVAVNKDKKLFGQWNKGMRETLFTKLEIANEKLRRGRCGC